jgi:hypothetical protein
MKTTIKRSSIIRKRSMGDAYFKKGRHEYIAGQKTAAIKDWKKAAHLGNENAKWLLRELVGLN